MITIATIVVQSNLIGSRVLLFLDCAELFLSAHTSLFRSEGATDLWAYFLIDMRPNLAAVAEPPFFAFNDSA